MPPLRRLALPLAVAALIPLPAAASICQTLAAAPSPIRLAAADAAAAARALQEGAARFTYLGHSTYGIETAGGVRAATDYAGWSGPGPAPDIVTMNRAHPSHFTDTPDPAIGIVLRGWNPEGGPAEHYVERGDVIVRNVTTDIRGPGGVLRDANSIFIFEVGELCIGHLGHLQQEPTEAQYAQIGRLDVVMAPVDGGYTMSQAAMIRVLKRFRARVVLPMHAFGPTRMEQFLAGMAGEFEIRRLPGAELVVSGATLPPTPTVFVPARF